MLQISDFQPTVLINYIVHIIQFKTHHVTAQRQMGAALSHPAIAKGKYRARPLDVSVASPSFA